MSPPALDRAILSLERARQEAPEDPAILNDLAVAYLELGQREQQLRPMLQALDAIERAYTQDSAATSILFNRALIHQRLYLIHGAKSAWNRYMVVERHHGWRLEAEDHARRAVRVTDFDWWEVLRDHPPAASDATLRTGIAAHVRHSPQAAREFAFRLLGEWGAAIQRDSTRASHLLTLAREIGKAANTIGADRSVSLAIQGIDSLRGERLQVVARAHAELAAGLDLYAGAAYDDAAKTISRAQSTLRSVHSPAAAWAMFHLAAAEVNLGRHARADTLLRQVLTEATTQQAALTGKALWALGVNQLRRGYYDAANRLYREAAPHFARAKERDNEGAISYLLAESLSLAGQLPAGQAEAYRGLRLLSPFRKYLFLGNHLSTVAAYARADGLSYAALAIMDEVLDVAHSLGKPQFIAWARRARAHDLIALGRSDAARAELAEAMRWADHIKTGRGRDRVKADVTLVLGQFQRSNNPTAAYRLLSGVVDAYRRLGGDLNLPTALHQAALAAQALGDRAGARRYLEQAVNEIERQQEAFTTVESRASFYETVEHVFDDVITSELESGRPETAFHYLERGRIALRPSGRREVAASRAGETRTGIAPMGQRLPEGMLLVEYALLKDRVAIWTTSRRGWSHRSAPLPRDSVAALLHQFANDLDKESSQARSRLFDLLIRPLAGELKSVRQLAIVPDRELYQLSFAALWDQRSRRYLMEEYEVRTVPSGAFLLAALAMPRPPSTGRPALVVGNPLIDQSRLPHLNPLPDAAREATLVAQLYPGSKLVTAGEAHRGRILGLLPGASIFHYAGHAVFNAQQPELSYLALAPGAGADDGIVHAWEIAGLRLSNLRVVILSACSTLGPRPSRSGVMSGLAYSFLAAGAPATISTLWDVGDDATAELLIDFHRRLAAGASPAEALRLAQQAAARSTRPGLSAPRAWAAFTYTGP